MNKIKTYSYLFVVLLSICTIDSKAQVSPSALSFPYNHLPWYTIEGDHFLIHYQEGSEKSATNASLIANSIYRPITELYSYEPERKVSIILRDREDYANGAAYFFDDKIDIWIPPLDTPLRGSHQWLRNVITHEFTHIVQMGASMKRNPTLQTIYFQWLSYEDVRRPDVLYGSPNGIITYPFSTVSIPAWFSEGTAQYMTDNIYYDYWDTHRDMILRMNILDENVLEYEEMGHFSSKNSLEREMVYNHGFDFTRFLTEKYGENVIGDLSRGSASGKNDFSGVLKNVTGSDGHELYNQWIEDRKQKYSEQIKNLNDGTSSVKIDDGFYNFYPQYDQQNQTFGYLTNRDRDYSRTFLVLETSDSTLVVNDIHNPVPEKKTDSNQHSYTSNLAIDFIGDRFSFSSDGTKVVYSKIDRNRYGEEYKDLFIFDIPSSDEKKITSNGRVQDPAWSPVKEEIVAVELQNGTQNLILIDILSGNRKDLTRFDNNQTVYTPVWSSDGKYIYFASADVNNRNLYRYNVDSKIIEPLFEDQMVDIRDPWVDQNNRYIYFSADLNGIFNIYRSTIEGESIQMITEVKGGAFMPFATTDSLYFSEYTADGYNISAMKLPQFEETVNKDAFSNEVLYSENIQASIEDSKSERVAHALNYAMIYEAVKSREEDDEQITLNGENGMYSFIWRPYNQTTTGLSVIPTIRFDNYTKLKGSNSNLFKNARFGDLGKNLIRDFKAGAYFTSRDVTERLSIFAGALVGWGSKDADSITDFLSPTRLNNLDRDLFLIIDHQGIPFIKRSWSPTVSIELYNLKRNVQDGVSIEEFSCTSCLPTQKSIDIRYHVWEANLFLRSKLNRFSLLELAASYSPYSVVTDGFFSNELKEFIPGSTTEYFKGTSYSASYIANTIIPSRHSDVAPEGARASASFQLQKGRLLQEFEIDEGSLSPVYDRTTNYAVELKSQLGGGIAGDLNGLLTSRIFGYLNKPADYFYQDYTGGLTGMKSYPYFAIGGQRTIWGRFSLLAPVKRDIHKQFGPYSLDKVYANLFVEAGNGWGGPLNIGKDIKTGIGTEIRFAFNSYYIFPLKLFVTTTYGFNQFNVTLPEQFISTSSDNTTSYGKELLFYFGLTFDFNQL